MSETQNNDIVYAAGWTPASVLVNATGDAMDNIWDVYIDWPWSTAGANGAISSGAEAAASYRCSGFNIPQPKKETYSNTWNGITVKKIKSGIKLDRQFELEFRLDANYALYNKFTAWSKITGDANTSGVANTESALGRVQLVAPGAEYNAMSWSTPTAASAEDNMIAKRLAGTTKLVWTFEDVQCFDVSTPQFKQAETGTALKYKCLFTFGDVAYPFYTPANAVAHNHKQ